MKGNQENSVLSIEEDHETQNKNSKDGKFKEQVNELKLLLKESSRNKNILNDYNPYKLNDILVVTSTNHTIFVLLRNGTLISIGDYSYTLGRKVVEAPLLKDKLSPIFFKRKIIDIACGKDHVLVKNEEFRLYTWGNNFYGQLGIPNFPTTWESNKEEPIELTFFNSNKVKQITCGAYNSFAINENNTVYGWGSNENGQLFLENENKKFNTPQVINLRENFEDFMIKMDRQGKNSYIYDGKIIILIHL